MASLKEDFVLSILIPNYNYGGLIGRCIESALNLVGDDVEIIVSDNCSSDESWNIISSYSDKRLKIIRQNKNIGLYENWNYLLSSCAGKYVKILSSDDYLNSNFNFILRQIRGFKNGVGNKWSKGEELDLIIHECDINFNGEERAGAYRYEGGLERIEKYKSIKDFYTLSGYSMPTVYVFRRAVLKEGQFLNDETAMRADLNFFYNLIVSSNVICRVGLACATTSLHAMNDRKKYKRYLSFFDEAVVLAKYRNYLAFKRTRDNFLYIWRIIYCLSLARVYFILDWYKYRDLHNMKSGLSSMSKFDISYSLLSIIIFPLAFASIVFKYLSNRVLSRIVAISKIK